MRDEAHCPLRVELDLEMELTANPCRILGSFTAFLHLRPKAKPAIDYSPLLLASSTVFL